MLILAGLLILVLVAGFVMYQQQPSAAGASSLAALTSGPLAGMAEVDSAPRKFIYPLSAFESGMVTKQMSMPLFLNDLLTLQEGDQVLFKTDTKTASIEKGYGDKWLLVMFSEQNERQQMAYDSWSDLTLRLHQLLMGSRYFIAKLPNGAEFHVGDFKLGHPTMMESAHDDIATMDSAHKTITPPPSMATQVVGKQAM